MRISARAIAKGHVVDETSVDAASGQVELVSVEGGQRATVLGLMLTGRMTPDSGEILLDDQADPSRLRGVSALVDAPGASAPEDDLTLETVLHEEMVFAGVRGARRAVRRLLADEGLAAFRTTRMTDMPSDARVRALAATAAMRSGVELLVLVSPDRFGGDPEGWNAVARRWAERGMAVIVLAGGTAVDLLRAATHLEGVPDAGAALAGGPEPQKDGVPAPLPLAPPVHVVRVDGGSRMHPLGDDAETDTDHSPEAGR